MTDHICVVVNEAGASEMIAAWLARQTFTWKLLASPVAYAVFKRRFMDVILFPEYELENMIKNATWVMTGSSNDHSFEQAARQLSKKYAKKVVTYLEHWVNYKHRFLDEAAYVYPDEIWVSDEYALELAHKQLSDVPVKLKPNYYIEDILIQIEKFKHAYRHDRIHILYVCEPISANRSKYGYDEFEALHGYLNYLCQHDDRDKFSIKIRPHPREVADKYQSCIDRYRAKLEIELNAHESLAEAIAWSDKVVGCETMAMVVALVANKKVYSAIPTHGRTCALPHKNIIKLFKA